MNCSFSENSVIYLLFKLQRKIFKRLYSTLSQTYELHPGQLPMLFLICRQPGLSQREIAERLGLEAGTVAVMMKRFERKGLISRKTDEKDKRVLRVYLSEDAQRLLERSKELVQELESEIGHVLTDGEVEFFKRLLKKLLNGLTDEEWEGKGVVNDE